MMRADACVALDEGDHGFLRRNFAFLVARFAADVGLIDFDDFALAAEWTVLVRVQLAHAFADAHRHKPRALVRDPKHPVKLMVADPLLAGSDQMKTENPFR